MNWMLDGVYSRFIASDPGLGKTAIAIRAADAIQAKWICVCCPAVGRAHWVNEFKKWAQIDRTVDSIRTGEGMPVTNVVITSYDHLSRRDSPVLKMLMARDWDVLILDEAHYLKSRGAARTTAVYGIDTDKKGGLAGKAKHVWPMSGTPAPNHAGELWTHLHALYPEAIPHEGNRITKQQRPMAEHEFQQRFCNSKQTKYGTQITGSKNLDELKKIIEPYILRQQKKDVLPDMPPLNFCVEPLDSSELRYRPPASSDKYDALSQLKGDALLAALRSEAVDLSAERRMTGMIKTPLCLDWIRTELDDNTRKLIVFAWHQDVIEKLMVGLASFRPVKIVGGTLDKDRETAIDLFQNDPMTRVFIGNIKAAGTVITLTAASDVVFVESSWTPNENYQAACRSHRIGQKDGVLARVLCLEHSVDAIIQRVLVRKQNELVKLFG